LPAGALARRKTQKRTSVAVLHCLALHAMLQRCAHRSSVSPTSLGFARLFQVSCACGTCVDVLPHPAGAPPLCDLDPTRHGAAQTAARYQSSSLAGMPYDYDFGFP
jgi:hypothetical protein